MGIRLQLSSQQSEEDDGASRFGKSTFATQSFPSLLDYAVYESFVRKSRQSPGNGTCVSFILVSYRTLAFTFVASISPVFDIIL